MSFDYASLVGRTVVGYDDTDKDAILVLVLDNGFRVAVERDPYEENVDVCVYSQAEWDEILARRELSAPRTKPVYRVVAQPSIFVEMLARKANGGDTVSVEIDKADDA